MVAFSNAQTNNISTESFKTNTIHNLCCMRMQKLKSPKMRTGNKQKTLTRLWYKCMVLVIEEINMVSNTFYNMLDFESCMAARKRMKYTNIIIRNMSTHSRKSHCHSLKRFLAINSHGKHLIDKRSQWQRWRWRLLSPKHFDWNAKCMPPTHKIINDYGIWMYWYRLSMYCCHVLIFHFSFYNKYCHQLMESCKKTI